MGVALVDMNGLMSMLDKPEIEGSRLLALFSLCGSSVFPVRRWFKWRRSVDDFWLKANGWLDSHGHCPDQRS
jgi:hypothetical protein